MRGEGKVGELGGLESEAAGFLLGRARENISPSMIGLN